MVPDSDVKTVDKKQTQYTTKEVAEHNKPDDIWVTIKGKVYNVTHFQRRHPGGELVLQGIAGEDGTIPFVSYHRPEKAAPLMKVYRIGELKDYKPTALSKDFEKLRDQLKSDGIFETDYTYYYKMLAWYVLLFSVTISLISSKNTPCILIGAVLLGLFWQQVAFAGHDLGHNAVTHIREKDWWYGVAVTLFFGVSGQWWKRSHNIHHIFPNSIDWDPDIQHLPFLSVDSEILKGFYSFYHKKQFAFDFVARCFIAVQHILFFPIMAVARYFMYVQSYILVLDYSVVVYYRYCELAALLGYAAWVSYLLSTVPTWGLRFVVMMISHAVVGILHIQITLSHFAMPAYRGTGYMENDNDHFIKVQLQTTLDLGCDPWLDWFHGGLQFQAVHHLFPLLPRHSLRMVREKYLLPFFKKHDLNYTTETFFDSIGIVYKKMAEQARFVRNGGTIPLSESVAVQFLQESTEG